MIEAAAQTLAEVGADQVSLRDVARRVGVSHAAPAHHFEDKAGMLTAVAVQGFGLFVDHITAAAAGIAVPLQALDANGQAYLEFSDLYPGHFDIMFRPTLINTDDPDYKAAANQGHQILSDLVQACQGHGWRSHADSTSLTISTWALFHGLALLRRQGSLADHLPDTSPQAVIEAAETLTSAKAAVPSRSATPKTQRRKLPPPPVPQTQ